jgi:hypothetical protein
MHPASSDATAPLIRALRLRYVLSLVAGETFKH